MVYIILHADQYKSRQASRQDLSIDETPTSQLASSLQERIDCLRRELEARNEELHRKDHLLLLPWSGAPQ